VAIIKELRSTGQDPIFTMFKVVIFFLVLAGVGYGFLKKGQNDQKITEQEVVVNTSAVPELVSRPDLDSTIALAEIGFALEQAGMMDCVVLEQDAKKYTSASVRYRSYVYFEGGAPKPIAQQDMREGDVGMARLFGDEYLLWPSEICKGALSFEIPLTVPVIFSYGFELPERKDD
jgi:hypothetical protein